MYTEQDMLEMRLKIRRCWGIFVPMAMVLLTGYVVALIARKQLLMLVVGIGLYCAIVFVWGMYLGPYYRYRDFLRDMQVGLSRQIEGRIVEISQIKVLQDGVRVLPVRVFLEDAQDERIVYLNVAKMEGFALPGERVRLDCFGRHIKAVRRIGERMPCNSAFLDGNA